MQNLIATKSMSYGGKRHDEGDGFAAKRQHARVLVAIGKAKLAPEADEAAEAKPEPKAAKGAHNRRDPKAKE